MHNVSRTVREYEAAGVAAIHIEDQVFPKRCAAMPGVSLMERKDAGDRVRVALESRQNRDFLIIARTDARPALGIEEAWRRGERFAEIGADMIYIEGLQSWQEIEETARRFRGVPLFFNVLEEWPWTLIPTHELGQMGFRIVIFCLSATLLYARTMQEYLEILRADGNTNRLVSRMMSLHDYEDLLGMEEMKTMEDRITKPVSQRDRVDRSPRPQEGGQLTFEENVRTSQRVNSCRGLGHGCFRKKGAPLPSPTYLRPPKRGLRVGGSDFAQAG